MIVITGASSGFGEAIARVFAREGHTLFLVARRGERLKKLSEELSSSCRCHFDELDVSDRAAVERWATRRADILSGARALVNNAGGALGRDPIQNGNPDHWDKMIDVNLKGVLWLTRALLPHLMEQAKKAPGPHIVNMGSVAGNWTYPNGNVYCAVKAAVHALSECLRHDLLGTGIRVTEIQPGLAETEFSLVRFGGDHAAAKKVYEGLAALRAEDIAEAVRWCLSLPPQVTVQDLVLYPTDQSSPQNIFRRS